MNYNSCNGVILLTPKVMSKMIDDTITANDRISIFKEYAKKDAERKARRRERRRAIRAA